MINTIGSIVFFIILFFSSLGMFIFIDINENKSIRNQENNKNEDKNG